MYSQFRTELGMDGAAKQSETCPEIKHNVRQREMLSKKQTIKKLGKTFG